MSQLLGTLLQLVEAANQIPERKPTHQHGDDGRDTEHREIDSLTECIVREVGLRGCIYPRAVCRKDAREHLLDDLLAEGFAAHRELFDGEGGIDTDVPVEDEPRRTQFVETFGE